jgi:hypothetical protein
MESERRTVELMRDGVQVRIVVELLEAMFTAPKAAASTAAPSPWSAKGFSWDDAWVLRRVDRGHYIAVVAESRFATIYSDDLTTAEVFEIPAGNDPRVAVWNRVCELGWHGLTAADAFEVQS